MLPAHLKKYVVEQDYSLYTPVDQEVWRYIMRQLRAFLSKHAHPAYGDGLKKTGIEIDRIPDIRVISEKLEKFGWHAVPVSGFIPPAAFMELQALGYLPIASDMRSVDHLLYTPAPDIVHEAAGHAPILVEEEFAGYLKSYAQVARKAIISKEDMDQYEAIRVLSDMKEDPDSTRVEIQRAEEDLAKLSSSISHLSEAALLGRMNWWTAEYGLIGTLENPRIFGAGLLSSVGEARECLSSKVKKIPLTLDCVNYAYDITEPQPHLFVTPDFNHLRDVLEELANTMAFRLGGVRGLEKAKLARTVNTVELNSGVQIAGVLKNFLMSQGDVAYLQFEGPTQLAFDGKELVGHSKEYHAHGFGSPVGLVEGATKCLSEMSDSEVEKLGISKGHRATLKFKTGATVSGTIKSIARGPNGKLLLITFTDCTVTREGQTLFDPSWGVFDMAVGSKVPSVFGGPADRLAYGETEDFVAKKIPPKVWPEQTRRKHALYAELREIRESLEAGRTKADETASARIQSILKNLDANDWLLRLSAYELSRRVPSDSWRPQLENELKILSSKDPLIKKQIEDGVALL